MSKEPIDLWFIMSIYLKINWISIFLVEEFLSEFDSQSWCCHHDSDADKELQCHHFLHLFYYLHHLPRKSDPICVYYTLCVYNVCIEIFCQMFCWKTLNNCFSLFFWRTRQDSNLWPLPSEGSALSSWATGATRPDGPRIGGAEDTVSGWEVQGLDV